MAVARRRSADGNKVIIRNSVYYCAPRLPRPLNKAGNRNRTRGVDTARKGSYDASISTRDALRPGAKLKSEHCVISVTDHGTLVFKPYRTGLRVNILRLFPYFRRIRPYYEDSRPDDIDGPRRISPEYPATIHPVL